MIVNNSEDLQLSLFPQKPLELLSIDEIYDQASESLLKELEEDRRLERKSAKIQPAALAVYFSMFSNTPPDGGIIAIGIEDNGVFSGCRFLEQSRLNELERAGHTYCPLARYETKRLAVTGSDGRRDFILLIRIRYLEDRVIETVKGEAYIRIGGAKKKLNDTEKRELQSARGQVQIEQELCPDYSFPEDFFDHLVNQAVDEWKKSRNLGDNHLSTSEVLELMHLGQTQNGQFFPNLACVLLFAKDPCRKVPGCKIRFLRFEGEREGTGEKFNAVKDIWIEGPVPTLIVEADQVLGSQLRNFSRLGSDGKFYSAPEYPKVAWYEAIVNACVHRSYSLQTMNIFIKMFDDRLEIESPGGFPGIVNAKNIYRMHCPRNPHLMQAMFYLDFVKCAHEGTRRMRATMFEMKLPEPDFKDTALTYGQVCVTLHNNIKQRRVWVDSDVSEIIGEQIAKTLSENEKMIINFAAENSSVNVSQVQRLTGRSWPSAKKLLMGLVDKSILEHRLRKKLERDPQAHFVLKGMDLNDF